MMALRDTTVFNYLTGESTSLPLLHRFWFCATTEAQLNTLMCVIKGEMRKRQNITVSITRSLVNTFAYS